MAERPRGGVALMAPVTSAAAIHAAFAILLQRQADAAELREALRSSGGADADQTLALRLLSSPEFGLLYASCIDGGFGDRHADQVETVMRSVGSDETFVDACYQLLLGRQADTGGREYYVGRLRAGASRSLLVRGLLDSEEFLKRFREISPEVGAMPRDVQLCELANPAKWDNPDWRAVLRSLGEPAEKLSMHRKAYEFAQTVFGLQRLGRLTPTARILSVGAGHEKILYWLAIHAGFVVATDLYEGRWQSASRAQEGDEAVIRRPEDYAPFAYPVEKLVFLKMDGRRLAFRSGTFDIAYSLSSIEHFGGFAGAREAVEEMIRVLSPGGMLVLATEYALSQPSPGAEVFTPAEIHAMVDHPDVKLVSPIDEHIWRRYEAAPVDLRVNPYQTPHLVVRDGDTVFTSVMMFLEKRL
jgi:SAM-dependent methyltransferase